MILRCLIAPIANCKEGIVLWSIGDTCQVSALTPFWIARINEGSVEIVEDEQPEEDPIEVIPDPVPKPKKPKKPKGRAK
jgi:hypothetical protein